MATEEQKEEWFAELDRSEAVQNYFKGFNDDSIESFKKHYIHKKELWRSYGKMYAEKNEKEKLKWVTYAFEHLEMILQKKLFDVQCLWRAEKVSYKEVEICEDFIVWKDDIFNCPFIEPINEEDIHLYSEYLLQYNAGPDVFTDELQDHEALKEAYNSNNADMDFPEWYEFHNGRTGNSVLLLLPDIRGEKEAFYLDIHFEEQREKNDEIYEENERKRDKRPWLETYEEDTLKYFVETFESKEDRELYAEYAYANRNYDKEDMLKQITDELLNADEPIPVPAHGDWFEALEIALGNYKCKKIAEALPMAFEQYQMNIQMGIAFPEKNKGHRFFMKDLWMKNIMNGRRLNGEPEDLNF